MKKRKRVIPAVFISLLFVILLLGGMFYVTHFYYSDARSGSCGDDLTYDLNIFGTLTVSGTGAMSDYGQWNNDAGDYTNAPWDPLWFYIRKVVLEDGVTSIGEMAFCECIALKSVTVPDSITRIGDGAFWDCISLKSITVPDGITIIGVSVFDGCSDLQEVTMPDSVTRIESFAFDGCSNLKEVTIPDGVISIEYNAFNDCTALTSVHISDVAAWCAIDFENYNANPLYCAKNLYLNGELVTDLVIPDSVISIKAYAFPDCTSLTSVTVPDGVTDIGEYAFYDCTNLASVHISDIAAWCTIDFENYHSNPLYCAKNLYLNGELVTDLVIPDEVTTIRHLAFDGCESLTTVTIPDSVKSIEWGAFANCTSLTSFAVPAGVTTVEESVLNGCTALTAVTIPDSVTIIEKDAFLDTAYYNDASNWEDGVLYIGNYLIEAKTDLSGACNIKEGTKMIAGNAFENCTALTAVTIPDSVTSIGEDAFNGCESLTAVTIPDSVTSIGEDAFRGTAYRYNDDNWEDGVLYIGNHLIDAETDLSGAYSIKEGTKTIAGYAFENCTALTAVTIPDSVTSIGEDAFNGCAALTAVTIPDSVTIIGRNAFGNCSNLSSVYISDVAAWCAIDFENYHSNPLYFAKKLYLNGELVGTLVIPDGTTSIKTGAFYGFTSLRSVVIPDSVTSIGYSAFYACTKLYSITIPDSVIRINEKAFGSTAYYNNADNWEDGVLYIGNHLIKAKTNLSGAYDIKEGTKTIAEYAFSDCAKLTSVTIPDSVTLIERGAFEDCAKLGLVYISDIAAWCGIDFKDYYSNPLYYAKNLYLNGKPVRNLVIPDGVTSIKTLAFLGCLSLTSVTIPDSVTDIESFAFFYCRSLTDVAIPDSVTTIGKYAFYGCDSLTSVTIPDSVTSIKNGAFIYCNSLTSITVLNPDCEIYDSEDTIPENATVYGYENSGAQEYAKKYHRSFVVM